MTDDGGLEPAPGAIIGGKYRIERKLGAGGMGAVYLAENLDLGRRVAIKLLHPRHTESEDLLRRFRLEARAAAAIAHPGIVDVLDLGLDASGAAFIVMEALEGISLRQRIQEAGRLSVIEAADILEEILDALGAAHAKQIIHRDLKPDNVFLVSRPRKAVKLLDFGISKLRGDDAVDATATGAILGTPLYMPPEQARGLREIGPPADLYAVGAVLHHMLAGRPPFVGTTFGEILSQVLADPPPPLDRVRTDVTPALAAVVQALLAKAPADRPQTAAAARAALRAALGRPPLQPAFDPSLAATADVAPRGGETLLTGAAPPIHRATRDDDALAATGAPDDALAATGVPDAALAATAAPALTASDAAARIAAPRAAPAPTDPPPLGLVTTHAGAAGEVTAPPARPRARWPLALGALALGGGAVVIALATGRGSGAGGAAATDGPHTADAAVAVPTDASVVATTPDAPVAAPPDAPVAPSPDAGKRRRIDAPGGAVTPAHAPDAGAAPTPAPDARKATLDDVVHGTRLPDARQ